MLNGCKDPLTRIFYLATLPVRRRAARVESCAFRAPIAVLFYHRVADEHPNEWTISTTRFKDQIRWLEQRFEIISLVEAQRRIGSKRSCTPAVCITFDDGYADNCRNAVPWLLERRIPFTYFVASAHVLHDRPFPHDVDRSCPLAPNTPDQIKEMADAGVEIGAHTRTHADLGRISDEQTLTDEIVGSKRDLQEITGRAVRYFAFPFGMHNNLSQAAARIAFQSGFWGVCSAYGGKNRPGDDPFHIQRIHGDPYWGRFCDHLTAIKRRRSPAPFDFGEYRLEF